MERRDELVERHTSVLVNIAPTDPSVHAGPGRRWGGINRCCVRRVEVRHTWKYTTNVVGA